MSHCPGPWGGKGALACGCCHPWGFRRPPQGSSTSVLLQAAPLRARLTRASRHQGFWKAWGAGNLGRGPGRGRGGRSSRVLSSDRRPRN